MPNNISILDFLESDFPYGDLNSSILNDIDAFVFLVDIEQLKPIWLNNFFYKRMHYTPEDLKQLTTEKFLKMFHPKSLASFKRRLTKIVKKENPGQKSIYQVRTNKGEWIYMLTCSRIYKTNPDKSVKLLLGFATEIEKSELSRHMKRMKDLDTNCLENFLLSKLSERETGIIKLITKGMTDKEIAKKLDVSIHTTKTHRKRIISKLGLKNTAALVKFAVENDLD